MDEPIDVEFWDMRPLGDILGIDDRGLCLKSEDTGPELCSVPTSETNPTILGGY
jgi:hypothetical protein